MKAFSNGTSLKIANIYSNSPDYNNTYPILSNSLRNDDFNDLDFDITLTLLQATIEDVIIFNSNVQGKIFYYEALHPVNTLDCELLIAYKPSVDPDTMYHY